ncbi:hypothetical protein H0H93_006532 [Arthromyces matolae]|nr:hypothetical protein H0H93_006532 [Arthromyces matolae]
MADEKAIWRAIGPPLACDAAANIMQRLVGVRKRIIDKHIYAGLPLPSCEIDISRLSWQQHHLFPDVEQLCDPTGAPFILTAFVSLSPSHYALSSPTWAGNYIELTAVGVRPTHSVYQEDYRHLLENLAKITGQRFQDSTSLVLKFRSPIESTGRSSRIAHDAMSSFPAYDMHDHRMAPWEHRSRLSGADVVVHFIVSRCKVEDEKQYFGHIVNVTVVVPPLHTWPVSPRVFGRQPSNPYPIRDLSKS